MFTADTVLNLLKTCFVLIPLMVYSEFRFNLGGSQKRTERNSKQNNLPFSCNFCQAKEPSYVFLT